MNYKTLIIVLSLAVINDVQSQYVTKYQRVTKNNSECIIDENNNELIPSGKYKHIWTAYDDGNKLFVVTGFNGKEGLYRLGEKEVLPCEFDDIEFHGKAGFAKKGDKWAVINSKPELVTDFVFEEARPFRNNSAWIKKEGHTIVIDTTGKVIKELPFDFVNPHVQNSYSRAGINKKFGYVDENANIVIPIEYDDVGSESDGKLFRVKLNGKWGFVNRKNEIVVPIKYSYVSDIYDGVGLIRDEKFNVIGAIDANGKVIYDDGRYAEMLYAGEGKYKLFQKGNGWGYIDSVTHRIIISPRFSYCEEFSNKRAIVKKDGFANIIDTTGNYLLPQKYQELSRWGDIYFAVENNKKGAINFKGEVLLPIVYDKIAYGGGYATLEKNNLKGIWSYNKKVLIEPRYDDITDLGKSKFLVKLNNKSYILDETGKETPVEK